jgi:hypothetical protein
MSNTLEEYVSESALILTGPAGCGKSHWIQDYAERRHRQLFVCPCRKDRTLRDGRQKLHIWGRRTEPAILWLEGADDLTPEAQAFLRRILETHAPQVQFILECRDSSKLQEPIRSRCTILRKYTPVWDDFVAYANDIRGVNLDEIKEYMLPYEYSYRRFKHCIDMQIRMPDTWQQLLTHRREEREACSTAQADAIPEYISKGYNPETIISYILSKKHDMNMLLEYGECCENSGSLWAFAGYVLP